MGLTVELSWCDKQTEFMVEDETSKGFGNAVTLAEAPSLSTAHDVNNGCFDVGSEWLVTVQPLCVHRINLDALDYHVSFNNKK